MPPRLKNFLEPDEIALYVCCAHHTEATLVTTAAPNVNNTRADNNNHQDENENDENDLLANEEDDDWRLAAAAVNNNNTNNTVNLNAAVATATNTATTAGNVPAMNTAVDFEEEESEDEEEDDDLWPLAATATTAQHPLAPPLANLQTQHVFRPTAAATLTSPPPVPPQAAAPPQPLQWQLPQPPPPPRPAPPQALLQPPPPAALAPQPAPGTASATVALLPDSLLVPSLEASDATAHNNTGLDLPLQPPLLHPTLSSPQEESAQQQQQPASLHYQGPSFATLLAASQHLTHQEEEEEEEEEQDQGDNNNTEEDQEEEDDQDNHVWHRRILPSAAFDEGSSSSEGGDDHEGSESWNSTTAAAVASALTTTTTATTAPRMVHPPQPRPSSSGVARIDVLNQASSSTASSFYASRVILLNPETTTYQDLQHVAANGHHHRALPDLMQAIDQYQSPRLTALGVRLLADYARHSVHVFFHAAPPLLQYLIERVLLNPLFQGHTDLLDTAAQVFRSLSTHELMDPMLLSGGSSSACGSNVSSTTQQQGVLLLPALSFIAQGGGVVPAGMRMTCTTSPPMLLDDANDSRLDLPRVPAPQHSTAPVFSFDGHRSSNPDAPLLAPRFSSATAQHVTRMPAQQHQQQPRLLSVFQASSSSTTTTATAYPQQQQTPQAPPSAPPSANPHPHGPWLVFSDTARAHVCICLMNLSCGPANKAVMARHCPSVLAALRALLLDSSKPSLQLKAVTTLKHLSNLESNDTPLITFPGLVHALGQALLHSISLQGNATACTTHACMAMMNLSISKAHKAAVYHTPGIMQALLTVLDRTSSHCTGTLAHEARVRACCVLSNLAIGYDNKWSMFNYPGLVDAILNVMSLTPTTDNEGNNDQAHQQQDTQIQQVRSKACSILWSLAAEKANQAPLVQTTRAVPVLVQIAGESRPTDARQKCVAALTLLAESPDNAVPLLHAGILDPLISILHQAGPDPTQWKDHTASWCVSCLMNLAQVDAAVPVLVDAGVVSTLAPLVHMDQEYQSLKAAMAVTLTSRLDTCRMGQETSCVDYALLRKMETVIPKMVSLLFNTLAGRGGEGYRYGVFTLSSSVACLAALAQNGPEFVQELVSTTPVCVSLLQVVWDFCVDGGTDPTIVGGGRNDVISAKWAIQALHAIVVYLNSSSSTDDVLGKNNLAEPLMRALKDAHKRFADHATGGGDAHVRAMISHTLSLLTEGGVGRPPSSSLSSLSVDDDDGVSSTEDEEAMMMQLEDDDDDKNENRSSSNVPQEAADMDMISTPQPPQRQQELPSSSSSLSSRRVVSSSSSSAPSTPTTGKRKQPDAPSSSVSDSASAPAAGYHPGSNQEAGGAADNFFSPVSVVAIDLPDFGDDSGMVRKPLRRRSSDPSGGGPGNRHDVPPAPRPIMTTQQQQQ